MDKEKIEDYTIDIWPVSTKIVPDGGIGINWIGPIGWGECVIYWGEDNKLHADTECLSTKEDKKFLKMMLDKLIDEIIIDE